MHDSTTLRLAVWSGPRNISTAMMRAWGNRLDTFVVDEPFYAAYLHSTKKPHPGADDVIRSGKTDWRRVVEDLTGPAPDGKRIYYQKHMTHHLLPHFERDWLGQVTNCFLIRHPRDVITSYVKIVPDASLEDIGFVQQAEIFQWVREHRATISPIVDAADVLADPRRSLGLLCEALGVPFTDRMLSWPPGARDSDGIWAKHWYHEVETSTGFRPYKPKNEPVPERLHKIYDRCLECYEQLHRHRLH